jgi:uncharacterized SAM-binding protein YcdF (DUF218 family)
VFFALSKILAFFAAPSNILVSLAIVGMALLFTRWARFGRILTFVALVLIAVLGMAPVGHWLIGGLENRFPQWDASRGAPTGFIILGGAVDPELSRDRGSTAIGSGAERLTIVAALARKYPSAKFIYSSGSAALLGGLAEADYVLPLFESFGIDRGRMVLENKSRNTAENAEFSKVIANPKPGERWVVITSAAHMPRAIGAFRAAGFNVEAYPVDWRTQRTSGPVIKWFVRGLADIDDAAHEYVGLLAYWLTGRSPELFPGPR